MGERIGRFATAVLAGTVLGLVLDIGPKPVDAQTPTPTLTPIGTPTPDRLATQVTDARATVTALEELKKKEEELKNIRATEIAIRQVLDELRGTPTRTPTPNPDVIVIPRKEFNELIDKGVKIGVEAELANRDKQSTPVPARPDPGQPGKTQDEHDPKPGPDAGQLIRWALVGLGVLAGGALVWLNRGRIFRRGGRGIPPAGPHDPLGTT